MHAQKKEIIDTDALIERYRKEIDDLKRRLEEKENMLDDGKEEEKEKVTMKKRRMSAQEKADESQAMQDLQSRIQQLTKLILTSQTVTDEAAGGPPGESRPVSPIKVDFDMSPYQVCSNFLDIQIQLSLMQPLSAPARTPYSPTSTLFARNTNSLPRSRP